MRSTTPSLIKVDRTGEKSLIRPNGIPVKITTITASTTYDKERTKTTRRPRKYDEEEGEVGSFYTEHSYPIETKSEEDVETVSDDSEEEERLSFSKKKVTVGIAFYNPQHLKAKGLIGLFQNRLKNWHVEAFFPVEEFVSVEEAKNKYYLDKQMSFGIFRNEEIKDLDGSVKIVPGTVFIKPRSFASSTPKIESKYYTYSDPKRLQMAALGQFTETERGIDHYECMYFDVDRERFEIVKKWMLFQVGKPYDLWGFRRMLLWPKVADFKTDPHNWYCVNLIVCLLQRLGIVHSVNPYALSTDDLYNWLDIHSYKKPFGYTRFQHQSLIKSISEK